MISRPPVCSLLGGNGSEWLTEWQRLLTPDLKRREKDLFLLVETTLACISGRSSCEAVTLTDPLPACASQGCVWAAVGNGAIRRRRRRVRGGKKRPAAALSSAKPSLGQPPATFQPTLFPWAESKRPWTLTLLTRRLPPPPGLLQALRSLDSSRRVSTCSRQRRWSARRASFRRNKKKHAAICLPDTEAVFRCCAFFFFFFYQAAVFFVKLLHRFLTFVRTPLNADFYFRSNLSTLGSSWCFIDCMLDQPFISQMN